jgi:tetratricopeptide (TPR) repeat protein
MKRILLVLTAAGLALVAAPAVRAQDEVYHFDRASKKVIQTSGTIVDESAAGIRLKATAGAVREIAAQDITNVVHQTKVPRLEYRSHFTAEEKAAKAASPEEQRKQLRAALVGFQEMLPKLAADKLAERHVQYRIARLRALLADGDEKLRKEAITALSQFRKEHRDSWQIIPVSRLLAQLQLELGDVAGARQTYEDLAATPKLPKEIQQESELLAAQMLVRGKRHNEAKEKLEAILQKLPPNDPHAVRVQVYLAECLAASGAENVDKAVEQLDEVIRKTQDPELKALAYNTQGDCYLAHGRTRDALWPYLWVDVVWNQDRQEHLKALAQLAKLFEEIGDSTRAKQYQEKLQRLK